MSVPSPSTVILDLFEERSAALPKLLKELREGKKSMVLENLPGSSLPMLAASLVRSEKRPVLILTAGVEKAEDFAGDFEFFGLKNGFHFPKWEVLPYDEDDLSLEVTAKTLDVLEAITRYDEGKIPFAVAAPVDALMQRLLPAKRLAELTVRINWGDTIDPFKLGEALEAAGYTREPLVEARGEFSIRGGIIDLFPLNSENPIRIDLFGDEIESLRTFDVVTQRSLGDLGTDASLIIPPTHLKHHLMDYVASGHELDSLLSLLPAETIVILDGPERYAEVCSYFENAVDRQFEIATKNQDNIPKPEQLTLRTDELTAQLARFRRMEHSVHQTLEAKGAAHVPFDQINYIGATTELDSWLAQIKKFQEKDFLVVVICDNDGQIMRFDELLREKEIPAVAVLESGWTEGYERKNILTGYQDVLLTVGALQTGFAFGDARLVVMTDREIFGRYKRRFVYKKIYKGKAIASSNEIRRGDYVVHVDHGIGKFLGMRVQEIDGRMVELIEILYADDDKLLVPVEKITRVQKYAGPEAAQPTLDKLGNNKWAKRRQKHTEEIERLAEELLKLYADRKIATRPAHPPDNNLQREFEASFLYQETPDQLAAITDSKKDMEAPRPMDRLVCGDVGYGKTEVAIRAIFKAVQSKRQAVVLCPTTILAQQHYNNFRERFADYPIRIEMISRFRKPAEVKEVKRKLKEGEVDVVVGTHALLAKDVFVKDLGLVVVDEEQRFGVRAKERLKELRTEVDILTLSATPIPRTLHLALSGLRDLSLITTPPPDRQPIKTKIISFEEEQIAEAILRELNRGGQVYFVHNRVATIQEVTKRLKEIVPHARITFAHGQMKEDELEETMLKFIDHQFDILVATTIIESGVDIPNCNTIIINRADAFGLAQLYQLRGRVGRERKRAYAYLIVPQGRAITEAAVKRLQAIEEFAELGVGFSIAMRDLEIRGAGDILGKAQHGSITEIGFELFCELLEDKVREAGGEVAPKFIDTEIKWDASSLLPPMYVPMEAHRVTFYKRLAEARSQQQVDDIETELRDRFGEIPEPAKTMLEIHRLRIDAQPQRVAGIKKSKNKLRFTLVEADIQSREKAIKEAKAKAEGVLAATADMSDQFVLTLKEDVTPMEAIGIARRFLAFMGNG